MENDTIKLLRECNAGIKMGVDSIDEMIPSVKSIELKEAMNECKKAHQKLGSKTHELLNKYGDDTKEPHIMAKGMSWIKTTVKLAFEESDNTVADLLTDGCNMGIKTLTKYLNEYSSADREVKDIVKDLIKLEQRLVTDVQKFL